MNNFRFHYARAIITVPKTNDIEMNREILRRIDQFKKDNRMYIDLMKFLLDNQIPVRAIPEDYANEDQIDYVSRLNTAYKNLGLFYNC